jgi:hypothetical protein
MNNHIPQLRYLGMISHPEHSEYGFQIENEDKSVRMLVLTIANAVFRANQLMVQEAPDLCYQKVMTSLRGETPGTMEALIPVTDSDIAYYRTIHPILKQQRKSFRKPAE